MASYLQSVSSSCGVALGGIGTGSVELLPDGEFHAWQIYNTPRWARRCHEEAADDGENETGALSFWVRTQAEGEEPLVRKLGQKIDFNDFTYTMFGWNRPVEKIRFCGTFPTATLEYIDKKLPVSLTMKATAPFVPYDDELSSLPCFRIGFRVKNTSEKTVRFSLAGKLTPHFAAGESTENAGVSEANALGVSLCSVGDKAAFNAGDLCFFVKGGEHQSRITADYARYLAEYIACGSLGVSQESFLFFWRKNGTLPGSDVGKPYPFPTGNIDKLTEKECDERLASLSQYASFASILRRLRALDSGFPHTLSEKQALIDYWGWQLLRLGKFGATALSADGELKPGEEKEVYFYLSWYFPNHYSSFEDEGKAPERMGHYYEKYGSARNVMKTVLQRENDIFPVAERFADLLYRTNLSPVWSDAWSVHLSTLVKDSWRLADGSFGLWEGLGYCGFHTTDISYHASFPLLCLFPELQKRQMRMGAAFQREDGRVHHFFTPDLKHVDNGFDRVDMNPQFILMLARDVLYTGDKAYLSELWQNAVRAMASTEQLDTDGDGLPDKDTGRNTYDAWDFEGVSAYISVLWLAALKAAVCLAEKMGEPARAAHWTKLLEKGKKSLEKTLWNGSYYDLWRNGEKCDKSLMSDQLDGEWFLRLLGLSGNLPDARVRKVLKTVFAANFDPEIGLKNASYPSLDGVTRATYENCQTEAVWTGIGYVVSSLALSCGLFSAAEKEITAIHNTQAAFGRVWNHWECGFRYTRPLSSFTTLLSLWGMKINAFEKTISLSPKRKTLTAPLITPSFAAHAVWRDNHLSLTVVCGSAEGFTVSVSNGSVTVN